MDKLAAIKNSQSNIDRLIIANIAEYANLREAIDALATSASPEAGTVVDAQFQIVADGLEAIRNSITTLARRIAGTDDDIVDVTEDENGMRLQ